MTTDQKLQYLIDAVTDMRIFQKAYFRDGYNSPSKQQNLAASKAAEKRVDELLAQLKSNQTQIEL